MRPKPIAPESEDLFRSRLDQQINMRHLLVHLAGLIAWAEIERTFTPPFTFGRGRPALSQLIAGLLYLQHTFDAFETVINTWVESPYWQYFCWEVHLQAEALINPSSLTRWRKRICEEGVGTLLMATIDADRRDGVVRASRVDRVIVDTIVMSRAIALPIDSRLLEKSRHHLVKVARQHGLLAP